MAATLLEGYICCNFPAVAYLYKCQMLRMCSILILQLKWLCYGDWGLLHLSESCVQDY